ncbi:MAG: metal ABC transporter permease [Smithella sp.]|nr:metal ABC transporter permease [Smithella sp.]
MPMLDFLTIPLFQKALIAAFLSGAGLSLLGVVILNLNLTTIRFALMHIGLLGAAVAMILGFSPLVGAVTGIVIASLLLGPAGDFLNMDTGVSGVLFMTGSLGLAFLIFYKAGVPAMDAFALFSGSILALSLFEVWVIGALAVLIIIVFCLFYREIQMVLYNQELAESLGVPAKAIRNALLLLTGLAIGVNIRMVGALLIDAAVLLPAMAALILAKSLRSALLLSALFGIVSQVGGVTFSMAYDCPSGASITLAAVLMVILSAVYGHVTKKIRK